MIGRLNHVAIAVRDIAAASRVYREALGAEVTDPVPEPDHGVTVVFVNLPNTKIEFLEPLGEASPILGFLERNPDGGIHHVCYEVDDILAARDRLVAQGARVLGSGEPKIGAHGKPVLFLSDHPVTGGYPVIAVVVHADLDKAAQLPPGASVRFTAASPAEQHETPKESFHA